METGIEKWVILRCYYAGVHFGRIVAGDGTRSVTLAESRRIWSWGGANTLSAIACRGAGDGSRIADAVAENVIHEVCEQITCSADAIAALRGAPVW